MQTTLPPGLDTLGKHMRPCLAADAEGASEYVRAAVSIVPSMVIVNRAVDVYVELSLKYLTS